MWARLYATKHLSQYNLHIECVVGMREEKANGRIECEQSTINAGKE